jgi:hypothetical protein
MDSNESMSNQTSLNDNHIYHTEDLSLDTAEKSIYFGDIGNHRIQKFDYNGNLIKSWGSYGTTGGQFNDSIKKNSILLSSYSINFGESQKQFPYL